MEVAKSLWLLLEHSNEAGPLAALGLCLPLAASIEAMVRVALEIALDGNYKKVLWWPDFWPSSQSRGSTVDQSKVLGPREARTLQGPKRDLTKKKDYNYNDSLIVILYIINFNGFPSRSLCEEIVRLKLAVALANAKGAAVDLSEFQKGDETELVTKLRAQVADLEAQLRDARLGREAAEARIKELEAKAKEAEERMAQMERCLEELRKEVKEYRNSIANQRQSTSQDYTIILITSYNHLLYYMSVFHSFSLMPPEGISSPGPFGPTPRSGRALIRAMVEKRA